MTATERDATVTEPALAAARHLLKTGEVRAIAGDRTPLGNDGLTLLMSAALTRVASEDVAFTPRLSRDVLAAAQPVLAAMRARRDRLA